MNAQSQTAACLLMIRPANFGFNLETAETNVFQTSAGNLSAKQIHTKALTEFDALVARFKAASVRVIVCDDAPEPYTPDAVFPNNWVTFHSDGTVVLYPMCVPNRRLERRTEIIEEVQSNHGFSISRTVDLTKYEKSGQFLEGTGSMVLDRQNKTAYACISPRTHPQVLGEFAEKMGYRVVTFRSTDENGKDIYHTNVLMSIGEAFAIVCSEAIKDAGERRMVLEALERSGHEIVRISMEQIKHFVGNMLQIRNIEGKRFIVMSQEAHDSLSAEQLRTLKKHGELLVSLLETVEHYAGGSARCMMAENFLPERAKVDR